MLHQGTIYSCTAPVALFVAAVLGDARTELPCQTALPWDDRVRPLRAALLEWLGDVGDSTAYSDCIPDPDEAEQACQAIRAELFRAVAPFIWNPVASVRIAALRAAGHLLRAPDLGETREALAAAAAGGHVADRPGRAGASRVHPRRLGRAAAATAERP